MSTRRSRDRTRWRTATSMRDYPRGHNEDGQRVDPGIARAGIRRPPRATSPGTIAAMANSKTIVLTSQSIESRIAAWVYNGSAKCASFEHAARPWWPHSWQQTMLPLSTSHRLLASQGHTVFKGPDTQLARRSSFVMNYSGMSTAAHEIGSFVGILKREPCHTQTQVCLFCVHNTFF